jgi:hypothetical protein
MTDNTISSTPARFLSVKLAGGLAIAIVLALGTASASAAPPHREDAHRGGGHRDDHGRQGWGGGYYPAPPVVYGGWPAQYPPVIYGPGIVLNIR